MSKLDTAWAISEIEAFLSVTAQVSPNRPGSGMVYLGTVMRGPSTEADARAHVVEQILDRVLPQWKTERPERDKEYRWLRGQASRAKTALERREELAQRLGNDAPEMDASKLHPWAWESGASFWRTGYYHQAVMQAAIRVNTETQAKLGRVDVSETKLFNEAFSLDAAKPGAPRLRLAKDDGSDTYKNLHRGARAFAEGLYAAIRNPGMHQGAGVTDEHLALEQLAAFSVLARWVDQATVETAS
ncbi:TIGR02391 family protein [Georgenia sp. H159]|uniref:TIGR02391 family protein n=1 Tax=Georgenia sp. H159 TaxID=3076115 RepID=UPI002D77729B|nr:TIGR02391 family protein [Georgenia sp. H159]